jgi:hypothetical protein
MIASSSSMSSSFSSSSSSSSVDKNNNKKTTSKTEEPQHFERTVYVHPLSQIILEYFQERRHDWIVERGLDRALTVHRDGSFELKLDTNHDSDTSTDTGTGTANDNTADDQLHRIWTSYDEKETKHWLTVQKGPSLHGRFLLQDNLAAAWHDSRKSLPDRIHAAVDEMISVIDKK